MSGILYQERPGSIRDCETSEPVGQLCRSVSVSSDADTLKHVLRMYLIDRKD